MKKTIIAMLLAGAAGAGFAHPQGAVAADYKSAVAKCNSMKGSDKTICIEEARAARAHANANVAMEAKKSQAEINKARIAAVDADYTLARARCADMAAPGKDDCLATARKAHATTVADVRAGREWSTQVGTSGAGRTAVGVRDTRAISKCEQLTGDPKAACLIDNRTSPTATEARADAARAVDRTKEAAATVANRTENAAERAVDRTADATERAARRTDDVAENAAQRTENATERAADRTRVAAANAADNTREAAANVADKTRDVASTAAVKTERAAEKTGKALADTAVTAKVKGALLAEEALKSLGIHVETEKGTVMLSGFVNTKQEADRALQVARGVEGVNKVESAIKVK